MSRSVSLALACVLLLACSKDDEPVGDKPPVPENPIDYQKLADETPWKWEAKKASLAYCMAHDLAYHQVEIVRPQGKESVPDNRLTIRVVDDGREVYTFGGHWGTVFTQGGVNFTQPGPDHLFVAEFGAHSSGCTVLAVDLKTGKELWRSRLKGTSSRAHSEVSNEITIETNGRVVIVQGRESFGNYLEFVDAQTGKTLGHREYKSD
jgi:hypothetical protein